MAWYRCGGTPSSVLSLPTPSEASGAIARFNTDLTENLLSAVAEFSASQASGTPTPSAPIPIVGVDKVNVTDCGKNLLSMKIYDGGSYNPAVGTQWNLTESTNEFTRNGNAYSITTSSTWRYFTIVMPLKSGINYFMHLERASTGSDAVSYIYLDKDFKVLVVVNSARTPYTTNSALNPPENSAYYALVFTNRSTANCTITITNPYVIIGSEATTFEPYNGTTALINLGGTYYGGSVDAVTGKITLTHKIGQITQVGDKYGTWDGEKGAFWYCTTYQSAWLDEWDNSAVNNGIKVDQFSLQENVANNTSTNAMAVFTDKIIRWVDTNRMTMTKEDYNTYLASNPINILYPLATPIVVYASNTAEIPTIVGDNQVFADSGNIAVKYFETVGHKI